MSIIKDIKNAKRKRLAKLFLRYLKENKILYAYKRNLNRSSTLNTTYGSIRVFMEKCQPSNWLTECFIWCEQEEGEEFWHRHHVKWFEIALDLETYC